MGELYNRLMEYANEGVYPMHMPGHKRIDDYPNSKDILSEVLKIDITEIDGFDNLNDASGIIKRSQERAARLYKSKQTYFLVNGSTVGILSAISAISNRGKKLIVARNCHKAVYNAAYLNKLDLEYIYPSYDDDYDINGAVRIEDIQKAIDDVKSIAGIVVTSPTYDGIVSDIKSICDLAHKYDIPVIVDEAHGAHFGFSKYYPDSSIGYADVVIHSVHKTLPAPTQTALMHVNSTIIGDERIKAYLRMYQSSSPSYILMAGIDRAMDILESEGSERLDRLYQYRLELNDKLSNLVHIRICPYTEPGKLVISLKNTGKTGLWLSDELRNKYKIETEMSSGTYALAILTMMDTKEGIDKIVEALIDIDNNLFAEKAVDARTLNKYPRPIRSCEIYEALNNETRMIELNLAENMVSAEYINLYPPGYPMIVPGEIISNEAISLIEKYMEWGFQIQGLFSDKKIKVMRWGN